MKYFATTEILELTEDRACLATITNAFSQHWKKKNQRNAACAQEEIVQPMKFSRPA